MEVQSLIVDNIKHEPAVEYLLVLPQDLYRLLKQIKTEQPIREFSIDLEKFDRKWPRKALLWNSYLNCKRCDYGIDNNKNANTRSMMRHIYHCKRRELFKPLTCDDCGNTFERKFNFTSHLCKPRYSKCIVCDKKLNCKLGMKNHLKYAHNNEFKCNKCPFKSITRGYYLAHKKIHLKLHSCETCSHDFAHKINLELHQQNHRHGKYETIVETFVCKICENSFPSLANLKSHLKRVHIDADSPKFECDFCSKKYSNRFNLYVHIFNHVKIPCSYCDLKFSKVRLKKHILEKHSTVQFECDLCSIKFKAKRYLLYHMQSIHLINRHYCGWCRERFVSAVKLADHKKVHIARFEWKCSKCNFIARVNCRLIKHVNTKHFKVKIKCKICYKKLSLLSIRKHMKRIHKIK
jgi:Zinc finger, C2H2 type